MRSFSNALLLYISVFSYSSSPFKCSKVFFFYIAHRILGFFCNERMRFEKQKTSNVLVGVSSDVLVAFVLLILLFFVVLIFDFCSGLDDRL